MSVPAIPAPQPGTDLVPDGWAESTMVPWLEEQSTDEALETASAQLAGLEAAYRTLGADTLELAKARRYLEIRWGELLPSEQGKRNDLTSSTRGKSPLTPNDESRFRQLAKAKELISGLIREATDSESITRALLLKNVRQEKKAKRVADIAARVPVDITTLTEFPVLYVDPPWKYEHAEPTRKVENHYPTMTLDELMKLDIPAAKDAVLFMWATSPKLAEALDLMLAWDFEYRTCAVWVKKSIGMGYYFRQRHELLLVGKRGNVPTPYEKHRPDSVQEHAAGAHSAKPEVFYELIDTMYPSLPKVELFARHSHEGWAAWGNQA